MSKPIISCVAAYTVDGAYGVGCKLTPWPHGGVPGDMSHFIRHTTDAPDERVNVLIGGKISFRSMGNVLLGKNRLLVGVSRTLSPGSGYGPGRSFVRTLDDALAFAAEMNAYRIIFIGGMHFWLEGLKVADEAHLTIVDRVCDDPSAKGQSFRLDDAAWASGMHLAKDIPQETPGAWAPRHRFQVWTREPSLQ